MDEKLNGYPGNGPTHILVECAEKLASVTLGVLAPLEQFQKEGTCKVRFVKTKEIQATDIAWCDILICVRGCEFLSSIILKEAQKAKRFLIYFLDDALLQLPENAACYEAFQSADCANILKKCISFCDVLCSANQNILRDYRTYLPTDRAEFLYPPVHLEKKIDTRWDAPDVVRFLYAGSTDHEDIVEKYLREGVQKLAKEFGSNIYFTFIGANPRIRGLPNVEYIKFIESYEKYQEIVEKGNFHIGLAPLEDSYFHHCKYFNKYIEYTKIGAVGIYSDTMPYQQVIENGENGWLCEGTSEAWYECMKNLFLAIRSNPTAVRKLYKTSEMRINTQFAPAQLGRELAETLPELISYRAPEVEPDAIHLKFVKLRFYSARTAALWKRHPILFLPLFIIKTGKILIQELFRNISKNRGRGIDSLFF